MSRRRASGFTLVELLIVVAIIGIIASIAIVNYLSSIERARQKRTMSDIRAIATAWEARAIEHHSYAVAAFTLPGVGVDYGDLREALTPAFAQGVPTTDGWGNPFEFSIEEGGRAYAIRSAGRDGVFESSPYTEGATTDPDCDIVYSGGAFICYPSGQQTD